MNIKVSCLKDLVKVLSSTGEKKLKEAQLCLEGEASDQVILYCTLLLVGVVRNYFLECMVEHLFLNCNLNACNI